MKSEKGFSLIETVMGSAIPGIIGRLRNPALLILIVITLLSFALAVPAEAQGLAISGTFYRQHFQLLPGETLRTPDIYIVVFNHEDKDIRVKLTTQTPPGVEIMLDQSYFPIPPGEQQKVEVGVSTSSEAVPGEYVLAIAAEVQSAEGEGITIAGAAEQRAKLTIIGETGGVHITTVSYEGEPFPAEIHLYQELTDQLSIYGDSGTGEVNVSLAPGDYLVQAFFRDAEVARGAFSLQANEKKDVTLIAQTGFIYGFSVVSNYHQDTGKIAFANIMYTIENIYQPLTNVEAILGVSLDNEPLEEVEIISVPALDLGSTDGSYKYIPSQGWQSGTYAFKLELFSQDKLCAQSPEKELKGIMPALPAGINWSLVFAAVGGLLAIVLIILVLLRFKKKAICFVNPEFSGTYSEKTGELTMAKIISSINNKYKPIPEARVELQVRKGNTPLENITLATLNSLEEGQINLEFDYVPEEGWQKDMAYYFKLALYIADKLYTITNVRARAESAP